MRRWVPRGLQHLVEAIQAAFIDYSDRRISEDELRHILLQRRAQLHEAREVTESIKRSRDVLNEAIEQARHKPESIAGSEALIFDLQSSAA